MLRRNVAVLAGALAFGLVAACTIKTESPSDGGTPDGGSTPLADSGPSTDGGDASPPPVDPAVCKASVDVDRCEDCCGMTDEVFQALDVPYIDCICGADKCATECASTFCAESRGEPDTACDTCMRGVQTVCDEKGDTSCDNNAACKAFLVCARAAACGDLPSGDGGS